MNQAAILFFTCLVLAEDNHATHWAFQKPARPRAPAVTNSDWVQNPIDAFIAGTHERHGLQALPAADKSTLIRRVYLDLIGLPPTREELHTFLADESPDAYGRVVNRLLASPMHGERWARHWMDVWRYSDWYGRRQVPDVWNSAPQVWRWRDWIVQSLNADKGYDRMIKEMLAADEIAPEDYEASVATGYIIRNWYALNPNQWMRDTVEHTGKAFLGLTLNCAHCHDHKYDPITQEDYFRFRAFFEPIQVRQDRWPGEPDSGPFQKYEYSVLRKVVNIGAVRVFDERLDAPTHMYRLGDERNRMEGKPPVTPGVPAFLGGNSKIQPIELPTLAFYPGMKSFIQQETIAQAETGVRTAQEALAKSRQSLATLTELAKKAASELAEARASATASSAQGAAVAPTEAAQRDAELKLDAARIAFRACEAQSVAADAQLRAVQARIAADNVRYGANPPADFSQQAELAGRLERKAKFLTTQAENFQAEHNLAAAKLAPEGDAKAKDAATKAQQQLEKSRAAVASAHQAMTAPGNDYSPLSPVYPRTSSGRRRALGEWIANRDNPLTARVAVNHIWMRHFGRPLVASVSDFGRNGSRPSHPELLDWLAVEFMESGWSMKHLHRLIVTSNTYRMASALSNLQSALSNQLTADPENIYLWRQNPRRMEAEVVRDSILHAAGQLDGQMGGPSLDNKLEATSRRRSLYFSVFPEGGGHPQFLELFDAPDPCDCYRRTESIVPQQALAMTNSQLLLGQSRLFAQKLWGDLKRDCPDSERRSSRFIVTAFEQILSRNPTEAEFAACQDYLTKQAELIRNAEAMQLAGKGPEGQPAPDSDPVVRACEGLVRALFSHDDFVTIR